MHDNGLDEVLVRDTLAGRREAFARLVQRHQDYAYAVAIAQLTDFDLASDVVQESFLVAYRDLERLRDPERFRAWLCGIVRRTSWRAIREMRKVRALAEEVGRTATAHDPAPSPHRQAAEAERRERVGHALARLNEPNRQAFTLHYVHDLSYAEIAEFLGVTQATVTGRLQRARDKLRKELTMVEDTFKEKVLPDDFSLQIQRLLDRAAEGGQAREEAITRLTALGVPSVDELCRALDAESRASVRAAAARALCKIGDGRGLRAVLRLLYADDVWRYWEVFEGEGVLGLPGARDALLDAIVESRNPHLRYMALHALARAKDDDTVFERVHDALRRGAFGTRTARAALECLCDVRPASAMCFVEENLRGANLRLRGWGARYARRRSLQPPIDACLKAFASGVDNHARVEAGRLVLEQGEEGERVLRDLMRNGSPGEQNTAALTLLHHESAEAVDVLKRNLKGCAEPAKWVRWMAGAVARHAGGGRLGWIGDQPLSDLPTAAWGQRGQISEAMLPQLERLCADGSPSQRAGALRALAACKGGGLIEQLRACIREGKPSKVAREAIRQMQRLDEVARPAVHEMMTSEHWTERKAALTILRRWGRLTPGTLDRGKSDSHLAVRKTALAYLTSAVRERGVGEPDA